MGWMKNVRTTGEGNMHLRTAMLLLKGAAESYTRLDFEEITCPEDSAESIKRRLVQARQELLMVIRELK